MNLLIDQGNTFCKIACIDANDKIVYSAVHEAVTKQLLESLLKIHQPENAILASVKDFDAGLVDFLKSNLKTFVKLGPDTPLPIRNEYASPQTLGYDRLAAAVGAWSQRPGKPLLVIDLGTAVTYDFVSKEGAFIGGNIAPGVRTRLKSLNDYTSNLPLVEPSNAFELLGNSTESAILAGVMQGILFEINGYMEALRLQHPDLFAFLTGGDLIYFDRKLKNGIFVDANLVATGLNRILRHNVHS